MKLRDEDRVREIIAHEKHIHQPWETAPLTSAQVERILRVLSDALHDKAGMGVTITQDHNGAWGPMGQRLVTLRFNVDGDHTEVSMVVKDISSQAEDEAHNAYLREDK